MRFLETLMLLSELILLIGLWFKPFRFSKNYRLFLFLPLLFFLLHTIIDGIRWQLFLGYVIAALLALGSILHPYWSLPKYFKGILSTIGVLVVSISFLMGYLLPVFQLPKPSGSFAVGKTFLHLKDSVRPEMITIDTIDRRELMVQIWYPANFTSQAPVAYMHSEVAKTFSQYYGLPSFILSHFNLIETHAVQNAPVATHANQFPVIVFSPGYMCHSSMYTSLLETWASHGYIIFSIDYTYEALASVFPNDEIKYFDPTYTDVWQGASWDTVQANIEEFRQTHDLSAKHQHLQKYLNNTPYTARVNNWVKDIHFVIDQLYSKEQLPSAALFSSMDLDHIGVAGHSVGGASSVLACATDDRIKATINMDGSQWGSLLDQKILQSFLWITAKRDDLSNSTMDLDAFIYEQVARNDFYHMTVADAAHANFYDLSLWSNYSPLTQTGSIDGHTMITILNKSSLAFFDRYLKEKSTDITNLGEDFKELRIVND